MDIFKERTNIKPVEYPQLLKYKKAIRESYWTHEEFSFTQDKQDFFVTLNKSEREAIINSILILSVVEVSVKDFWLNIHKQLPKHEIFQVGVTFGESEERHFDAYSFLLEYFNMNDRFETIGEEPTVKNRLKYLKKFLKSPILTKNDNITDQKEYQKFKYTNKVLLFSLFIENVSLFSQFYIIMAFNKEKNLLKGISNVVQSTMTEEALHSKFGAELINIIFKENPTWFTDDLKNDVKKMCMKAYQAEHNIIKWIFKEGELDYISLDVVDEFIKNRFNESLEMVNIEPIFEIDSELLKKTEWLNLQLISVSEGDFFYKRLTDYTKKNKAITAENIF